MEQLIVSIMNEYGYMGIIALITLENVFPPIPSEVILTFGGFMTLSTKMSPVGVIISATLGSNLGALILYWIGRLLSPNRIKHILEGKVGKILRFKGEDVDKAVAWFNKKGKITVLLCRCVPVIRSFISIPAGMSKMNFPLFLLLTTIGSAIWNTVLVLLGVAAGESWEKIVGYMGIYSKGTLLVLAIIGLVGGIILYKKKYQGKSEKESEK